MENEFLLLLYFKYQRMRYEENTDRTAVVVVAQTSNLDLATNEQ